MAPPSSSISRYLSKLATPNKILATATSIAAAATMAIHSFYRKYLPSKLRTFIHSKATDFFNTYISNEFTLIIDEFVNGMVRNEIYDAADMFLSSSVDPKKRRLRVSKAVNETGFDVSMAPGQEFVDVYNGEEFRWVRVRKFSQSNSKSTEPVKRRSLVLKFHQKNREMVMDSYLPYLINKAETTKPERTVEIFNMSSSDVGRTWKKVKFDHPATFNTLSMDFDQKNMILSDLDRFVGRREHYRRIGKAWKRGYLLYGPPGTGKSSLVAAIANYLKFNVYDLQLTEVKGNSQLSRLLLATKNQSILVVEDIDCSIDLQNKMAKRGNDTDPRVCTPDQHISSVTLSGLLNFVDGLWSSCGDERIIIFTTNHKEKLDPALLRPGRMDVHIHLSYCSPCGFELLASNYLGITDHVLFEEIEDSLPNAKVTPAEVAEQLLQNDEPDIALQGLADFIHKKIKQIEKAAAIKKAKSAQKLTAKPETDQQECKENGKKLETAQPEDTKEKVNEDEVSTSS